MIDEKRRDCSAYAACYDAGMEGMNRRNFLKNLLAGGAAAAGLAGKAEAAPTAKAEQAALTLGDKKKEEAIAAMRSIMDGLVRDLDAVFRSPQLMPGKAMEIMLDEKVEQALEACGKHFFLARNPGADADALQMALDAIQGRDVSDRTKQFIAGTLDEKRALMAR